MVRSGATVQFRGICLGGLASNESFTSKSIKRRWQKCVQSESEQANREVV
jgi:hypothetical protein